MSPESQQQGGPIGDRQPGEDRELRAAVVGRVLAGDLDEQTAADQLGVTRSTLVRWKAQALESLDSGSEPGTGRPDGEPQDGVPEDPRELVVPRPDAQPDPVPPRLVAAAGVGVLGLLAALAVTRPAGMAGFEVFDAINRWLLYGATLFACGGVLFLWRLHDARGSRAERHVLTWWVQVAAVVAVVTSMVALLVHAAAVAGVGPAGMIDHHEVGRAADGAFGVATVLRLLGLVYIVHALRRTGRLSSMMVAITGMMLALGSFLLVGHTATGEPRVVVVVADLVHTVSASGWFGGLILLAVTLRHRRATGDATGAAGIVGSFSTFAAVTVAALFTSGVAMAMTELSSWSQLLGHEYGVTILVKTGLVLLVLGVAGYNNRRVVPGIRIGDTDPWGRLRATLSYEIAGLAVVVLVTAVLVNLPSPG